ncbi:MAG: dihydrodipicolinate synthase family protein [Candidatus Hydrogenedentes bacterium]|nr:dihydrodipicolinate synthase family protein [Candidatus Hydrogenedentota bacterium]
MAGLKDKPAPPAVASEHGRRRYGPFRGMMPIMATPVDNDYKVDLVSQRRLVDYCIQCGAVAVGHFANASEFKKISDPDRSRLLDVVAEQVNGRVPFFAGVTGKTSADILRYAREAQARGADLMMCALPYEEELDQPRTLALFQELAATADLPIIIQDMTSTAHIFTPELVMQIAEATGQIHSIKAESDDFLTKTAELQEQFKGAMQVIGGAGGRHLIHLLRLGATAFMTGTEAVEIHGAAVQAYLRGDEEAAASVYYERILPYLMFYSGPNSLRNLKMMLHMRGIINTPNACAPDDVPPAYSPVVMKEYLWTLERIGWNKTWPNIP